MVDVVIAGVGQTPVGEHWGQALRELALRAIEAALADAGGLRPEALYVANALSASISNQTHLGALVGDFAGLRGLEANTLESGGASGGSALRAAYQAIAAGSIETALVVGVEKCSDQPPAEVESALAGGMDSDFESMHGVTPTIQAALLMQRYLNETQAPRQSFAGFPMTAHANAVTNPNAMFRSRVSAEAYQAAGPVSDPLNMFDAAPAADGAAAVLLARSRALPPAFPHPRVRIIGSAASTDFLALHDRPDLLVFEAAQRSVERACRQAGIVPGDVDLFELHDAYSIFAVLSLEAAGFAARGEGWRLAQDGQFAEQIGLQGKLPIGTFGGLKARGYPIGAVGVYQAVEAALQLRGQAGKNQVEGARRAMIQCLGGPAATAVTHVLDATSI